MQAERITCRSANIAPHPAPAVPSALLGFSARLAACQLGARHLPPPLSPQAALAAGLLQLLPWKPRTVGALGVIASAMNCYQLCPPLPAAAPAVAPVAARREEKAVAGKSA